MKILVTGAGGMLGSAFLANPGAHEVIGLRSAALDISHPDSIRTQIAAYRADVLINCAADTDVEGAEARPHAVLAANALLPEYLAQACHDTGAIMVQISSTGCYGSWKKTPYVEEDELRPTTVHHAAKAQGEERVRNACDAWLIVRTGWLYGASATSPKNFIRRRLEEAAANATLLADSGQTGNPTRVDDVVSLIHRLLDARQTGTFNCVAHGAASRFEFVRAIVDAAKLPCQVRQAPEGHFKRLAPVSPNEAALNARLQNLGLDAMPDWRTALERYVSELVS